MLTGTPDLGKKRKNIKVIITYDFDIDDFIIVTEFEKPEQTIKCIQLGLQKFLEDNTELECPECGFTVESRWLACPECGLDL